MRRTGLLARLLRRRAPQPAWRDVHAQALLAVTGDVRALEAEVERLRSTSALTTAAAVAAELRADALERQLASTRTEVASLRADLSALREELVWAFAEGKVPIEAPTVIDLTKAKATSA